MAALTHPVTGHQISVDDESAEFWRAAGYRGTDEKPAAKKAPAKKASSSKKK